MKQLIYQEGRGGYLDTAWLHDGERVIGPYQGADLRRMEAQLRAEQEIEKLRLELAEAAKPAPPARHYRPDPGASARMGLPVNSDLATRFHSGLVSADERAWAKSFAHPELEATT